MTPYDLTKQQLRDEPKTWLVTGVAGFIGCNLLESLLELDQRVIGLDNFSTGRRENLDEISSVVSPEQWARFQLMEGDTRDPETCREACQGVDYILHQAALGSVPRSLANPFASHDSNVTGIVNMLNAARESAVSRFVYASSSSVYGDHPDLPKREEVTGECLSPYAVTKKVGELYATVFARSYGMSCIGLRYFNVFGARQNPNGPYAAVIPKWVAAMLEGEQVFIFGDGETSRDFCYIRNAVQANILAARTENPEALNKVYNIAVHARTTLNTIYGMIRTHLASTNPELDEVEPVYREFRDGDVRHSEADITRARELLGYEPSHTVGDGLGEALDWYVRDHERRTGAGVQGGRLAGAPAGVVR